MTLPPDRDLLLDHRYEEPNAVTARILTLGGRPQPSGASYRSRTTGWFAGLRLAFLPDYNHGYERTADQRRRAAATLVKTHPLPSDGGTVARLLGYVPGQDTPEIAYERFLRRLLPEVDAIIQGETADDIEDDWEDDYGFARE